MRQSKKITLIARRANLFPALAIEPALPSWLGQSVMLAWSWADGVGMDRKCGWIRAIITLYPAVSRSHVNLRKRLYYNRMAAFQFL